MKIIFYYSVIGGCSVCSGCSGCSGGGLQYKFTSWFLSFALIGAQTFALYTKLVPCTDIYNAQFTPHEEVCTKFI